MDEGNDYAEENHFNNNINNPNIIEGRDVRQNIVNRYFR